ncbi:MAG: RagB/SusD family nutrient uptake outer membrane protein [Spirosomataceae bacterium]
MRNTHFKILSVAAGLFIFSGCSDRLELQPEQSLSESLAFASGANAQASLLGVYSQAQLLEAFGSGPQILEDFMADNTEFVGSFPTLQDINLYVTTSPNATIQAYWQVQYRIIIAANAVIANVPTIQDPLLTPALAAQYVAEAKFLRAITYFNLVNQFGQPYQVQNGNTPGVPLVLTPFTGEITFPERATVNQVHQQIQKDLTEALADLPVTYSNNSQTRGRATKGAAAGFLARLHLYRGEFQQAASFASQVISSANYAVAGNFGFYGATPTPEHVFALMNSATDNGRTGSGGWASYHRPAANGGRGDCAFTTDLVNAFLAEPGDKRYTDLSNLVTAADGQRRQMTTKFNDAVTNTDVAPIMRTSEIYLTRAEALAELNGINQESITLVNAIRSRAGLPAWTTSTFSTKEALVNAILTERRKELCFEGHRRMDLLRRGQALRRTGTAVAASAFGQPRTILPIPQREIDLNPNLTQNAGY